MFEATPRTFSILPKNLMKNIEFHIFFLVKNKKTSRNFFWENYQLLDIAFWNKYLFFRYEKITNVSHIYIGLLLLHTVTIYFVVLHTSNVSASWRNGIASDFDMSGILPLPWVRVPATPLSFFNFSFFFFNGLLFQKFLEQFQKFLEHLSIVFWTINLFFEQFTIQNEKVCISEKRVQISKNYIRIGCLNNACIQKCLQTWGFLLQVPFY